MTAYLTPLLITAAASMLTYVFCIRPMLPHRRKGVGGTPIHGACHMAPQQARGENTDARLDTEMKRLREEIQLLRHEADLRPSAAEPFQKREVH
ncbi:hypothetical protein ACWD5R_40395 [Streptomyces sp. NPDC002514]|uniref:hypothetical protein n=1 Tax=Streptomyces sp. NPDC001270 TaxID=3364554 RepID=UPI0036B93163